MKFSEAMLKGYEKVGGKQWHRGYCPIKDSMRAPTRVCVLGAINLAEYGNVSGSSGWNFAKAFYRQWGVLPEELNDEGLHWTEIYGMAVAAGL